MDTQTCDGRQRIIDTLEPVQKDVKVAVEGETFCGHFYYPTTILPNLGFENRKIKREFMNSKLTTLMSL